MDSLVPFACEIQCISYIYLHFSMKLQKQSSFGAYIRFGTCPSPLASATNILLKYADKLSIDKYNAGSWIIRILKKKSNL